MWQALAGAALVPGTPVLAGIALLAGLVRGFAGFGAAMVFVPLAALVLAPVDVIVVLLMVDVVASLVLTRAALPQARLRPVAGLFVGAVPALPLGVLALDVVEPTAFRWAVAGVVLGALAALLSGWRYRGTPGRAVTVAVGAVSGFMGGFAALAGPPVILFFLGGPERAVQVRASIIIYFLGTALLAFLAFGLRGALSWELFLLAVVLAMPFLAGTLAGARLFRVAGEGQFRHAAYGLIALAAILALPVWS